MVGVSLTGPLGKLTVQRPSLNEFPLCDYSFKLFFELLGVRNIIKLLTCILLEHQVLIKSSGGCVCHMTSSYCKRDVEWGKGTFDSRPRTIVTPSDLCSSQNILTPSSLYPPQTIVTPSHLYPPQTIVTPSCLYPPQTMSA